MTNAVKRIDDKGSPMTTEESAQLPPFPTPTQHVAERVADMVLRE